MYAVEMIVVMPNGEPTNGKSDKHKKRWKDWRSTMKTSEEMAEEYERFSWCVNGLKSALICRCVFRVGCAKPLDL